MKLICADLESALPDVPPCTVGAQWVLLRLHRRPIGLLHPPAAGCTAAELGRMALREHGWSVAQHLAGDHLGDVSDFPSFSRLSGVCPRHHAEPHARLTVAVCTHDRAPQLRECLDALAALTYPLHLLDIVIVDNAPSNRATRDVIESYPGMRYVCEPRPGLDWARNRAITEARGDIVAFTDDDVSVDPGWAEAIVSAFAEEPHAMCVTGLVVPDALDTDAQILFEQYGGFGRGFARHVYKVGPHGSAARMYGGTGRFGTGANMAFRRIFFDRAGLFDPALDVGTPAQGGGDLDMFFRVLKTGHALVYEPSALVRHRHRRTYAELRTQIASNGIGFYSYLVRTATAFPDERIATAWLATWWLWWWNIRRLLQATLTRSGFPVDLILAELRGSFTGLRRYAAARRQAAEVLRRFGAPAAAPGGTAA